MMGVEKLSCYFDAAKPTDVMVCLSVSNGIPVWNIIFIGLLALSVIGWGAGLKRFDFGMAVGGFLTTLVGIPMFALELITVEIWMFALIIALAGLIVAVINGASRD